MLKKIFCQFVNDSANVFTCNNNKLDFCRQIATTCLNRKSIRDVHGVSPTKLMVKDTFQGTEGSSTYLTVNTELVDKRLPDANTLKQLFNGIPYEELPIVYVKSSRNNTLIHAVDSKFKYIVYTSCRMEGFKHARKKTNIAGQTTGMAAGQKLLRRGIQTVRVILRGLGPGRMTSVKGMATAGVQIVSIGDRTWLPEIGPRPRKIRRV